MDVNTIAQNHRFSRGSSEWMRIDNIGNVGIGSSSLTNGDKLTVNGNIKLVR